MVFAGETIDIREFIVNAFRMLVDTFIDLVFAVDSKDFLLCFVLSDRRLANQFVNILYYSLMILKHKL